MKIKHEEVIFESLAISSWFGRALMCKGFFEKPRYLIVHFFFWPLSKHEALIHNFKPLCYIDQQETIQVGLSFVKNSSNVERKTVYSYVAQLNSRSSFKLRSQFSLHRADPTVDRTLNLFLSCFLSLSSYGLRSFPNVGNIIDLL